MISVTILLYPCLAWVQREQKAATNEAKFGAHFTQIVRFSASDLGYLLDINWNTLC